MLRIELKTQIMLYIFFNICIFIKCKETTNFVNEQKPMNN